MSLGATVRNEAAKMKGLRSITVSASADKKHFIAEHNSNNYEDDIKKHVLKSKSALAAHMAKHLDCCNGPAGGMEDD